MENQKSKLYTRGKIGSLELKNRVVMTPLHLGYCPDGEVSDQLIEFYRLRAQGGVGLIVVGAVGIDPSRVNQAGMIQLHDDRFISGLKRLTAAIHAAGAKAKIFPQLWHGGRYQRPKEYNGQQPVAPSAVFSKFSGETPREMTALEIDQIISYFSLAAQRAKASGFDGVELAGSAGYLIAQFLSPLTNLRQDRFGGNARGRLTFALEVIEAVRSAVGPDFPIMMRIAGNDFVKGGLKNADIIQICLALEKAGLDALNVTGGWHESHVPQISMQVPAGAFRYLGRAIKDNISIPVVVCNRIDIRLAEEIVDENQADFIGVARGLVADPDLVGKAQQGAHHLIRPCVACNQGCMDNVFFGKPLNCLCNPEAGREADLIEAGYLGGGRKTSRAEKILVVGAGVAGLEYARVAAKHGHLVTVWEESEQPGGQLFLAAAPPGRSDLLRLQDYLSESCKELKVAFVFKKKATKQTIMKMVKNEKYNRVVLATGATPATLPVAIDPKAHIVQAWDVLKKRVKTGTRVVVVGGGAVGVETALSLAEIGTMDAETLRFLMLHQAEDFNELYRLLTHGSKSVTLVEMAKKIGRDIGPSSRWSMLVMLKRLNVTMMDQTSVVAVMEDRVVVEDASGQKEIPADTVVLAIGSRPNNELYSALSDQDLEISLIGDALLPRNVQHAIRDAYDEAVKI